MKKKLPVVTGDKPKTMLPEVLPDPRGAKITTNPRRRTLDRLQSLLAASAAAATLSCGGNGPGGTGYAVVDPMPMPPSKCFDASTKLTADAELVAGEGHAVILRLKVDLLPGVTDVTIGEVLHPEKILKKSLGARGGVIEIEAAGSGLQVTIDVSCEGQAYPGRLEIYASWSGETPLTSKKVTLSVNAVGDPYRRPPEPKAVAPDDPRYAKPPPK